MRPGYRNSRNPPSRMRYEVPLNALSIAIDDRLGLRFCGSRRSKIHHEGKSMSPAPWHQKVE